MIDIEVNPQLGVLTLVLDGPLASADVRTLSERTDARVRRADHLAGLLIKAPHMPAWRELSGFLEHLRCMARLRPKIQRIALLTESPPSAYAAPLQAFFPQAQLQRFGARSLDAAQAWLRAAPSAQEPSSEQAPEPTSADETVSVSLGEDVPEAGEEDAWFN